jgi:N6-L-threonylcarbamoyladenine synthase
MNYFDGPVLGIETSCDETSIAVLQNRTVLSNIVSSQALLHKQWGGVVPEAAARRHVEALLPALEAALSQAQIKLADVEGIGVTNRPGLVGALSVGVTAAKALSWSLGKPLLGVHHLEGHILSALMENDVPFPHVCLLVSGGHTEIIFVKAPGIYERLGGTIDDAAGEAFDKVARTLGLGYPGGPAIEVAATSGDSTRHPLPRGLKDPTLDFSFAGIKTAVVYLMKSSPDAAISDVAASFQETVTTVLAERTVLGCKRTGAKAITLVGGVAANKLLRRKMLAQATGESIGFYGPSMALCTDNAAMIAHVASWRLAHGERSDTTLDVAGCSELPSAYGAIA